MHPMSKLSLFKNNTSQLSLLSNPTEEQSRDRDRDRDRDRPAVQTAPAHTSPAASPVHPPPFPHISAAPSLASSPLSPNDPRNPSPFSPGDHYDSDSRQSPAPAGRRKLQRRQSLRSTPVPPPTTTTAFVGTRTGSAGRPPSRVIEDRPQPVVDTASLQPQASSPVAAQKKRRFWGFGSSTNARDAPASAAQLLGRRLSTRTAPAPAPFGATKDTSTLRQKAPTYSNLPSPTEEDDPEALLDRRLQNRHSVAFPTPTIPADSRSLATPTAFDATQPTSQDTSNQSVTTASSQSSSSGHVGSQRSTAWERIGRTQGRAQSAERSQPLSHHQLASNSFSGGRNGRPELNLPDRADSRPPSRQSIDPPSPSHSTLAFHHKTPSVQSAVSISEGSMGPSTNQQNNGGRNPEGILPPGLQSSQSREGQYGSTLSVNNQQASVNYRNTPQASPMVQTGSNSEQGRNTPPPSRSRDDLASMDVQQLLSKHEELNDKYRKVKKYYFDKDAQVQQLQNTLAHQRLAQSRTSLDDNEYATRFNRLDGAINNLAFNIRKDWKAVPRWLAPYVNQDATSIVTKEMTAVGRACISRWIVDEIFDRYFHPGLEPNLSSNLKIIERNLRRFAPPTPSEEEREALLAKISNWRLASLDGLQDMLNTHDAFEYRSSLTKILVEMLTSDLMMNLKDPAPPGLDAGVVGIIELAVGVAANLPSESRDVFVDYIMPGTIVNETYMKVESVLPPLINPGDGVPGGDADSNTSMEDKEEEENGGGGGGGSGKEQPKRKGVFGTLMSGGKRSVTPSGSSSRGQSGDAVEPAPPKDTRVRFAAFMSVEVRGKSMLVKAPVYV